MNKLEFHIYRAFHLLVLSASSFFIVSCNEDTHARTESVEVLFHEDHGMEWHELSKLIDVLSASGHFKISVNGIQIELPPLVPLYDSVPELERLKIHIHVNDDTRELDYSNHFDLGSLDQLEKLLSENQHLKVVALSFDGDCDIDDVFSVIHMFNSFGISFSLARP